MKRYRLGFCVDIGSVDEERVLLAAKSAGFDAFSATWEHGNTALIQRLWETGKREGMYFCALHAPFDKANFMWQTGEKATEATDELLECVRLSAKLNVPIVIVHPYIGFDIPAPNENGLKNFQKIIELAERLNVKLAFENVEGEAYLAALMEKFGDRPCVGFCWDTGHEQCYNLGEDVVKKYANGKLWCTHFNDNLGASEPPRITWLDDSHMLPYDGIVDWKRVMRVFRENSTEDVVLFELVDHNRPDRHTHDGYAAWDTEEFVRRAYERALRVVAEK